MTGSMTDNVFSGEAVSVPPFVEEDPDAETGTDTVEIVSPDSEEGASALEDNFDESMSDKIDTLINKIDDLITLGKIDKLIDSLNEAFDESMSDDDSADFGGGADIKPPDMEGVMDAAMPDSEVSEDAADESEESEESPANNEEKEAAMATIKKRAAAEDQVKDTQTSDEILDQVVDQGTMFDQAQEESHDESTVPDSANVGDNYAGSTESVSDTDDLKPVTTSAAMRLADAYIKAGVLKEADRYNAIDRIASTMTRTAARNQLKALDLVRKAASRRKASGFVNIPRSEWRDYLYLWDDGTDPDHEYEDVTSVNIVSDPETGNFGDMGFATFKNGDTIIFNSHGSKIVHDISAKEAERMLTSGEGINASKKRNASKRKAVTVRKAEDGSFTITTDPGFSATMTQTDDGVDGMINGEEQHFDTMDEAVQYIADNTGLDIDGSATDNATASRRRRSARRRTAAIHRDSTAEARRRAAIRRAKIRAAARKSAASRTAARKTVRMTAAQRKELAARIAKARRIAKASSNSNRSMHEAALNAARKKAARNPRLASASTVASTDAALSLI